MPSESYKQARTMAAALHDRGFARRLGIPKSVAAEYVKADERSGYLSEAMKHRKAMARHLRKG